MRPTFMGFETAKSSVFTNQKSIDIIGNNLSNINTNGYTRQRVDTRTISPSSVSTRVSSNRIGLAGQGVEAIGVSQMRDSFLDKRFRDEYSKTSYHSKATSFLSDIQSALGDGYDVTDESGILGGLQQIYESIYDYAMDPTKDTQANLVMSAFRNITQVLQQLDTKLTNVAQQQAFDMGIDVDRVNDIVQQLADLNLKISSDNTVLADPNNEHYRPNELMDQRNLLLDELAGYGDINIKEFANGMVDVTMGGSTIVSGTSFNALSLNQNKDGTVDLRWREDGKNVQLTGGSLLASIEFLNGRGNNVQNGNETPQKGILYYRDRLNTFAQTLADLANSVIPEQLDIYGNPAESLKGGLLETDANGNPVVYAKPGVALYDQTGTPLLDGNGTPIVAGQDGMALLDANGLPLNAYYQTTDGTGATVYEPLHNGVGGPVDGQSENRTLTIYDENGNAIGTSGTTGMDLVNADGEPIKGYYMGLENGVYKLIELPNAAQSGKNGLTEIRYKNLLSSGSNTNDADTVTAANISLSLKWNNGGAGYFISSRNVGEFKYGLQLATGLTGQRVTFKSYGETFEGSFEEYVRDYSAKLGSDVSYQSGRQEATGKVADDFMVRRDEISGVSRDEETANMLMYQKSYEAAARLMTTLDDLLDIVINRMGRVGL